MSKTNNSANTVRIKQSTSTTSVILTAVSSDEQIAAFSDKLLAHGHITEVTVNPSSGEANIRYDISKISKQDILKLVHSLGYATENDTELDDQADEKSIATSKPFSKRQISILAITCLFTIQTAGTYFGKDFNWFFGLHVEFVLATVVQFILCFPLYKKLYGSLRTGINNTDILIIVATQTIWTYSTFIYFNLLGIVDVPIQQSYTYFELSVTVLGLATVGYLIKDKLQDKQYQSSQLLNKHSAKFVEAISKTNSIHILEPHKVKAGYFLQLTEEDIVCGDGTLAGGIGWFDQSHVTGNTKLVKKQKGDNILSGSRLVDGKVIYQINHLDKKTLFGSLMESMHKVQQSKINVSASIDRLLVLFVPLVIVLAIATFLANYYLFDSLHWALLQGTSVLIVACPCLFWLSKYNALILGTGIAAKHGIWFDSVQAIQAVSKIDTLVINKTNTITNGDYKLVSHYFFDSSIRLDDVLQLAASVESCFEHPIAATICKAAQEKNIQLFSASQAKVFAGEGVEALVEGMGVVRVGKPSWIGTELPEKIKNNLPKPFKSASLIAVSISDIPLGFLLLLDEIKPEMQAAIAQLQQNAINTVIVSGDDAATLAHIADTLGVTNFYANLTPNEKVDTINQLKSKGHCVAMVGDDENDSDAIVHADASFNLSYNQLLEAKPASAILMGKSIVQIIQAKQIAQKTVKLSKQNLLFALSYNILAIIIAILGYLQPISAAILVLVGMTAILINIRRLQNFNIASDSQAVE